MEREQKVSAPSSKISQESVINTFLMFLVETHINGQRAQSRAKGTGSSVRFIVDKQVTNKFFSLTNDHGKYLCIPILHEKVNRRPFPFILDKDDSRLSNWKAKVLSFASRVTHEICASGSSFPCHAISLHSQVYLS